GQRGVAVGLNNIVKIQDGEPLGGRVRAQDEFADEDFDDYLVDEDDDFMS
ncbi:MAG: ssDNA-binding protein, partial [Desulfitobacterium hafniense]